MRNCNLLTDGDHTEIVNKSLLADRAPITDFEIPREINLSGIVDVNVLANSRAETSKNEPTPSEAGTRAKPEQQRAEIPEGTAKHVSSGILLSLPVAQNI